MWTVTEYRSGNSRAIVWCRLEDSGVSVNTVSPSYKRQHFKAVYFLVVGRSGQNSMAEEG